MGALTRQRFSSTVWRTSIAIWSSSQNRCRERRMYQLFSESMNSLIWAHVPERSWPSIDAVVDRTRSWVFARM